MQLSCLPVSFFADIVENKMTVSEWAQMGKGLGLDAIDLSILFFADRSQASAAALRREIEAEGMRVAMVTTYPDFTHPNPEQRRKELKLEQEAVALAAEVGAELVRVTAGQAHPETGREEGIAWAVEGLTELLHTTCDSGVTLVYENHGKPGAWQYTDFSQPPDIFLSIANSIDRLGINFDTANATAFAEDPVALLDQVINRVVSIHAADTAARGRLEHVLFGTGVTPFEALFQRLKQANWDGWICMEEAAFQGRAGVETSARFIRQVWESA